MCRPSIIVPVFSIAVATNGALGIIINLLLVAAHFCELELRTRLHGETGNSHCCMRNSNNYVYACNYMYLVMLVSRVFMARRPGDFSFVVCHIKQLLLQHHAFEVALHVLQSSL